MLTESTPTIQQLHLQSTLEGLNLYEACIEFEYTTEAVLRLFESNTMLPGLILMDGNQIVGIISRRRFFEHISRRYSRELLTKRPRKAMYEFIHSQILILPGESLISAAVRESLGREPELIYEPIVVETGAGVYKLLDVHQLLMAHSLLHEIALAAHQKMGLELRSAKNQLRAVLDAVPGSISWIDANLTYLGVNQRLAEAINLSPQQFVGQKVGSMGISPQFVEFVKQFFASSANTSSQEVMMQVKGNSRTYLIVAQKYNQGASAVTVGIDITALKQLEAELRASLEREKELGELKSRFISMTSHEFRTPLSTILSSAELLEYYGHKWTDEKKSIHLNRIKTAVKQTIQMLDGVLAIGKAEAGGWDFKPFPLNLGQFCLELLTELQPLDQRKHEINFINNCQNDYFRLDEKLLKHILTNLVSNAIKYSAKGSTIKFEIGRQYNQAIFQIEDKGIGIPIQDQQHLFESFHRATNVGNIPGTGLGLAIVKRCVDLHGGEISVESQEGQGTKFIVRLPC